MKTLGAFIGEMGDAWPTPEKGAGRQLAYRWIGCAVLVCVYFTLRLPNLRGQPVFSDEATYLRWGQLIALHPLKNLLISMEDAKLPLHYWLLALTRWMDADPVHAGRLLSVIFGALTLPMVYGVCGELARLREDAEPGADRRRRLFVAVLEPVAAALFIFVPLIAFYQRMVLAEPLVLLETCVMAWLSLRLARRLGEAGQGRGRVLAIVEAVLLGVCWSAALLTKQNFSYVLWMFPWAALAFHLRRRKWRGAVFAFAWRYAISTGMGLCAFVPVVMSNTTYDLRTRLFYKSLFTSNTLNRSPGEMAWQNLVALFSPRSDGQAQWWPHNGMHPLEDGMLYIYLTPPVLLLALAGIWMATRRGAARPLGFLGLWSVLLVGTLVVGANVLYSRYLLAGAAGLILAGAWVGAELLTALQVRWPGVPGRLCAAAALLGILAWPAAATTAGARDIRAAVLTREDREQYLSGNFSGLAAEQAVAWIRTESVRGPLAVVTGDGLSVQDDYAWLMLRGAPHVRLYSDDVWPRMQPVAGEAHVFALKREQWEPAGKERVRVEPELPVYVLATGMQDGKTGAMRYGPMMSQRGVRLVQVFVNPPAMPGGRVESAVGVFQVNPGERGMAEAGAK